MRQWCILLVTLFTTLIFYCSQGGTTDTGNARIAGMILTPDGDPAIGAAVTVCPAHYHPEITTDYDSQLSTSIHRTNTDATGYFRIDSIDNGAWAVEVNDNGSGCAAIFQVTLEDNIDSPIQCDTTLRPYSGLTGNVGTVDDTTITRCLVAYGLEHRINVSSDGSFLADDLPAGTYNWRVISNSDQWHPIEIENVTLLPESTVTVVVNKIDTITIRLNTTASGAAVAEDVYDIPILVRLTENNFNFKAAQKNGEDVRFIKQDGTLLPYEIESWDSSQQIASVWVRLDTVEGNYDGQRFFLLYGDSTTVLEKNDDPVFTAEKGFLGTYHLCNALTNSTSDEYHGIDSGSNTTDAGIIGSARSFNGVSQFFSITNLPDREYGTISCWFHPKNTVNSSTSKTQGIWGKKNDDDHDYTLSLQGSDFFAGNGYSGRLISKLEDHDTGFYLASTTESFSAETWYYVAWTWGNGGDSLFINGKLEAFTLNSVPLSGSAIEEVGRCYYDSSNIAGGGPRYFNGIIDEFRIDIVCRNAAWIKLCFMNQRINGNLVTVE